MFTVTITDNGFTQRLTALQAFADGIPLETQMQISEIMLEETRKNFDEGGRPTPWLPNKAGTKTLVKTGRLRNSGAVQTLSPHRVVIEWGRGLAYAAIHQFGGVIQHPGSKKLQSWVKDGKGVFSRSTKPHPIPIPQRRYLRFTDSMVERIKEVVKDKILHG